ncbi:MAG: hypothetical protein RIR70_489 [Pseudomonadota bacterium]
MSGLFEQLTLFRSSPPAEKCERHIQIGARIVTYRLVRGSRRTVGLTIDARGLRVGAPRALSVAQIERFILDHGAWVLEKLDEWASRAPAAFLAIDGASLPVLGKPWVLRLESGNNRLEWRETAGEMVLRLRAQSTPKEVLRRCLRAHALDVFLARAVRFAPALKTDLPQIALSNAATRWGSCSSISGVRLNWRLIHLPYAQIDYVIAHEFAHLTHMNHSPRFWAEVARLYPDFETARSELKRLAGAIPQL